MDELRQYISLMIQAEAKKIIVSNPVSNSEKYQKIVKKIYQLSSNKNLIISVTNSRTYLCFDKFSLLLDLIKILENLTDTTLENSIYDMLWHLRFNLYSKGTIYLKDAIIIAYYNNILLYDTNKLIKQVAQKYNLDEKNI